jgi:cytochrome c oxidase accessory protein FixG
VARDSRIPEAREQVLSTLNRDGSRRWIRPHVVHGRYWRRRLIVAWSLIAIFTAIPYIRMYGKPLMLFDIARREFTLFGTTFLATDTMFLMLLLVGIFVSIFLLTAIFGRVWCGWACPQTVYMEFVYRPIEQLIEGGRSGQIRIDRQGLHWRRVLKYVVFALVSLFLAHTFLAYFVGVERLVQWVQRSPFEHPAAFLVMVGTAVLMFADFAYFREQVCIVACPYGRFQSVMLDRNSLIVGYDARRGEPRGKVGVRRRQGEEGFGDCVACNMCVVTCPTGIDIREGLQMECLHCTQCMDACDQTMTRVGKPLGLIRYGTQEEFEGRRRKRFRPRLVLYPAVLAVVFGLLGLSLAQRETADVTLLRGIGTPYIELPSGEIANQLRVKIVNRSEDDQSYRIELVDLPQATVIAPENPLPVEAGASVTTTVFVHAPPDAFEGGRIEVDVRVRDGDEYDEVLPYRLLGPYGEGGAS